MGKYVRYIVQEIKNISHSHLPGKQIAPIQITTFLPNKDEQEKRQDVRGIALSVEREIER